MVVSDAGDHGAFRFIYDIGRILCTTDPALQYYVLTSLPAEFQKCNHGHNLEKSKIYIILADCIANSLKMLHDIFFADHDSIDLHSLSECVNMGRREHASFEAQTFQARGQFKRDRTFSICACNMDDFEAFLRIIQCLREPSHLVQSGVYILAANMSLVLTELRPSENFCDVFRVKVVDGGLIFCR